MAHVGVGGVALRVPRRPPRPRAPSAARDV